MLTEQDIREYQSIYKSLFQVEISTDDAHEQAVKLILLMETVSRSTL